MKKQLAVLVVAFGILMTLGAQAPGVRLHPALEQKLKTLAPGEKLAVIVELDEQVRPAEIVSAMRGAGRGDRARAVIGALRGVAERRQVPLLARLKEREQLGAAQRVKPFWIFDGVALTAPEELIRELASRPEVREVRLDIRIPLPSIYRAAAVAAPGEWNIGAVRAPEVWALDSAYDGSGAVVGSFDTGVDLTHPDLFSRYRGNHAMSWFDPYGEHAIPYDFHGHGTHTTGIAVGGDASGSSIGVAPGAVWVAAKGWDDQGVGLASAFHEIFEWFLAPGGDPDRAPDVVNCSWAFDASGCDEEFLPDIEAWRAAGIFPAFAAGNDGPDAGSVRSPAAYPASFAVGATDVADAVADFSGQGPSPCDGSVKPDIAAPGDGILSAVPLGYDIMSGTSMAAPHVSGAVAVLRSIDPALTVDQLESLLTAGAKDLAAPGDDNGSGAGRLDLFVSAQIAILGPDVPVVKAMATDAAATEAGPTSGTFLISRTGDVGSDLEVRFTVGGTATPASDYASIGESLVLPAGQASAEITVAALDDSLPEQAETVTLTISPDPDYIVSGSGTATVTIQSDELLSDLAVSSFTVPAAGAGAGESLVLTDTTRNQGAGASDPSVTQFYLSANSAYDAADILLGGRVIGGLAAGAASSGSTSVTVPAGTAAGGWYIIALADGEGTIPESSETNNGLARAIKIGPDLAVTAITAPTTADAGLSISITDTTKNLGGGAAPASLTRYFLSPNSALDASDARLGARSVAALAAGTASSGSAAITIPADTAAGLWYIIAKADGDESLEETSESNNTLAKSIKIGPDLAVSAMTAPSTAGAGLTISIADTTKNQGGGPAAASLTQFFLSSDSVLGATDSLLGARSVPGLVSGATSSGSTAVTIPEGTAMGTWFLIAKADGPEAVTETSETNNNSVRSIRIGPDLAVSAITAPTASGAGRTITVADTTKNQGGGAAQASRTRIYLSANTALTEDDTVLGTRNVAPLAGGLTSPGSLSVAIPSGASVGTWYILGQADCDGAVTETTETNNTMARAIKIGPDLVVAAISGPAMSGVGESITVTDSIKNQGGGAAAAFRAHLFLSSDSTSGTSDVYLGGRDIGGLEAGATDTGSTTVTVPDGTAVGTWYIIVKADAEGAVPETAETNNAYPKAVKIGPDLDITAIAAPSTAGAGQAIVVTDTVKNIGGGAAAAAQTYFYLSANSTLDAADVFLGAREVPGLAGGATSSGPATLVVPAGTAAGTWYLIGKTDGAGAVAETSESNNTFLRSIKVI